MKKILFIVLISPLLLLAQDIRDLSFIEKLNSSVNKYGADTVRCEEHLSIYSEFYKQKSYDSAFESWLYLFKNAPKRTKNIYIHGANMYKKFIKNEEDSLLREGLIDDLLIIYDHRNYYYPGQEGMILGYKGSDLYRYRKSNVESAKEAYDLLKESFNIDKEKSSARALNYYFSSAAKCYQNKLLTKEDLIDLFAEVSNVIEYKEAEINQTNFDLNSKTSLTSKDSKKLKKNVDELQKLIDVRANMEKILAPHVSCEKLEVLYTPNFDKNQEDLKWLQRAATLLKKKECFDSDIYFKIAGKLYDSNPNPRSAFYMGYLSLKKGDFSTAIDYFSQAVDGEDNDIKKADYLLYLAKTYAAMDSYQKAKTYALQAAHHRSGWGSPYILIGDLYAKTSRTCGENTGDTQNDEFTKRVGYWAAIEKYEYAKRIDASSQQEAIKKINIYKEQMPDKTSTFNIITLQQKTYKIDCWYSETVQNPYYSN